MNSKQVRKIVEERLSVWGDRLIQYHATPFLVVGVGHDYAEGQIHVCVPKQMKHETLVSLLKHAVQVLDATGPDEPLSEADPEPEPN